MRIGHDLIVARQAAQLVARLFIEIAEHVGGERRRQPVWLCKDDVEGNRCGAKLGELGDEIGDARAGPRPLTEFAQACLIDIDDHDGPLRCDAGLDDLKDIESPQPELFKRQGVGDAQEQQRHQQRYTQHSRGGEPPRQTREPFHVEPAECAVPGAPTPSLLPEHPHQLILQRLHKIGNHRPIAGLHESFDRHAGNDLDVAKLGDLFRRQRNPNGVIGLAGALIGRSISRNPRDLAA